MTIARVTWLQRLRSARTFVDFYLRDRIRFRRKLVSLKASQSEIFKKVQNEMEEFLKGISAKEWEFLQPRSAPLKILDIGAKDFAFGPAIERYFESLNFSTQTHGIEIDAFRRFADFRTRLDYASYFAAQMKDGRFHAMDFLDWKQPADVLILLHPFVHPEPLLRWGLPLRHYQPAALLAHCRKILEPGLGALVVSTPTFEEQKTLEVLAVQAGLKKTSQWIWKPTKTSIQKKNRIGSCWRLGD